MCLVVAQFGHLAQAGLPEQGQVDGGSQRQQALVGADVGGGALALDVLFAGGQGQHVGALAAVVHRLADQASGHLVDVLLAGGEEAQVWAAVGERDTRAAGLRRRQCPRPFRRGF